MEFRTQSAYIEITSVCNLQCKHCYHGDNHNNDIQFLTIEQILSILVNLKKYGLDSVSLSGGEPTLHNDIIKLIDTIKDNGYYLKIITNAIELDENIIDRLCERFTLQISVEGSSGRTNDLIRGIGSFDKTLNSLEKLKNKNKIPYISLRLSITKYNIHEIDKIIDFYYEKYGITQYLFKPLQKKGQASINQNIFLSQQEYVYVVSELAKIKTNYGEFNISVPDLNDNCPLQNVDNLIINPRITVDGSVFLCQAFTEQDYSIGNILINDFKTIIESHETMSLLDRIKKRRDNIVECRDCCLRDFCSRGCPAIAIDNGSLMSTDGLCFSRKSCFLKNLLYKN